eukprot:gb/GEZN01009276.1/.p1 GENE.gb/GEZN01009276.1/~~gb/GEZN01009276.1/.p1  ORF type:complete len:273 (+),score=49.99 gb/GEZN01009276.1/:49-867(+)
MFSFALLASCSVISLANLAKGAATTGCNAPSEFSASFTLADQSQKTIATGFFQYDAENYRTARTFQGTYKGVLQDVFQQINIWKLGTLTQYNIDLTAQTCEITVHSGQRFRAFGVPPSSNMTSQFFIGGPDESISTILWTEQWVASDQEDVVSEDGSQATWSETKLEEEVTAGAAFKILTEVVTTSTCWPVSFTQVLGMGGDSGQLDVQATEWYNVVRGISNVNLFKPPNNVCKGVAVKNIDTPTYKMVSKQTVPMDMQKPTQFGLPKIILF